MCIKFWTSLWKKSKILLIILTVEIFIFWPQNISVAVTLTSAVTGPKVTFADRTTLLTRAHENRATVKQWNTRLHRSKSPVSQQYWPQPSRLLYLGECVYCNQLHDVAQLKSCFIEEWEYVNQMINWSSMTQPGSDVHVFKLALSTWKIF